MFWLADWVERRSAEHLLVDPQCAVLGDLRTPPTHAASNATRPRNQVENLDTAIVVRYSMIVDYKSRCGWDTSTRGIFRTKRNGGSL